MTQKSDANRILFLDNLRYLMVLMVVILHSAISYSNIVPWWSVIEPHEDPAFFNILLVLFDVFLMPVLYFIAGYFAISSFQKRGTRLFLKAKFKRLGLPLLIGLPLVGPSFSYMYHYTRNGFSNDIGFGQYWVTYMKSAGDFQIGIIDSIDQINHAHLWFISLLLFFFMLFALFPGKKWPGSSAPLNPQLTTSDKSLLITLTAVGLLSTLSALIAGAIFASPSNPDPWVTIGNILQFQPDKVVSYMLYFGMGIYAFQKSWFIKAKIPGHPAVWTLLCVLMSLGLLGLLKSVMANFSIGIFIVYLCVRSFLCVSFLVALTSWAVRYWNRPSQFNALLALNSYYIYITHFLIVILLQLLLTGWSDGSVFIKFGIVSLGSILFSYGISQYAIRPYPRWSVVGIGSVFIMMLLCIHPGGG